MRHDWNVLATSRSGHQHALLQALQGLGAFESASSRDVVVGKVPAHGAFLDSVADRLHRDPRLPACLGRLIPVDLTIALPPGDPIRALEQLVTALAPAIGNRSYHVRVVVHGHHELHGIQLEGRLADCVWDALSRDGSKPYVRFEDADVVLQVEVVGDTAGAALLDRHTREAYPFLLVH